MAMSMHVIKRRRERLSHHYLQLGIWVTLLLIPGLAAAKTTGSEFQGFYTFVYDAATGYLGRGIAITGGLIMLGVAAGTGRATMAILGVVLTIFGALGPDIIDAIFGSATI